MRNDNGELIANPAVVGKPTPQKVLDAVEVIREYMRFGWWREMVILVDGGFALRLESQYDSLECFEYEIEQETN